MATDIRHFHWADYVVFGLSLVVSAGIGIYYGLVSYRKSNSTSEFLMGGRRLSVIPVALSLHASFMSAIFVLGTPAEIYLNGSMYGYIGLGYLIAAPVTAHFFLPVFYRLNVTSCYEFLERRFSKPVRSIGSLVFVLMMLLYMAIVLYTPALAFSQVTGLSMLISVVGIGLICTFYTALGGIKAVVWTDAFQMVIIMAGLIALLVRGTMLVGGWSEVMTRVYEGQRVQPIIWSLNPFERHTIWTQFLGGGLMTLTLYAVNQAMVQRYLSVGNIRSAQLTAYFAMFSSAVYLTVIVLLGFVLYAFYYDCDPLTTGRVGKPDQMIPMMVMDVLGSMPGLPGLFTASTFSAALSTVSSGVNSLAAVLLEDHIKPLYHFSKGIEMKDQLAAKISRAAALFLGLLTIGLAMLTSLLGPTVLQITLSLFGICGGPLLGLFCIGLFFPCVDSWSAVAGLLSSLVFSFWLKLSALTSPPAPKTPLPLDDTCSVQYSNNHTYTYMYTTQTHELSTENSTAYLQEFHYSIQHISYMWYTPLALFVAVIVALLVSLLSRLCYSYSRVFHMSCLCNSCDTSHNDGCCTYVMVYEDQTENASYTEQERLKVSKNGDCRAKTEPIEKQPLNTML